MNFALDFDGVISAFPEVCQTMMSALTGAGHRVYVITGIEGKTVGQSDIDDKRHALTAMGIGPHLYHDVIVCPKPHAENKLKAVKDNDIAVLMDNSKKNCKAVAQQAVAFLLWNDRK